MMISPASPDNHAPTPETLEQQARVWLRTLTSGQASTWDADAFKRWLHTSPAHQAAFREVKQRWETLRPGVSEMLRTNPEAARLHRRVLGKGQRPSRRAFLGAAVGAAAAAAASVAVVYPPRGWWPAPGEWGADFHTATGEQRIVALSGEISVMLNTQTSIRRETHGAQVVGIDLLAGEAAVDMASGAGPFTVAAGAGRSLAQAGRFEVRYLGGKVCVSCLEGALRIEHPAGALQLQARQQVVYDANKLSGVAGIDPVEVSAWRRGELVFNRTRLADVLDEINRYRPGRVMLMNDAARAKPVSGRFAIASLDSALFQLEQTFDLEARALPAGLLILS